MSVEIKSCSEIKINKGIEAYEINFSLFGEARIR